MIEFNLDGTIITANDNFLKTLGYDLDEIKGRHHSMFVDAAYRQSASTSNSGRPERGEFAGGEFKRSARAARSLDSGLYNPILDLNGKPFKVVKFATDVTAAKRTPITRPDRAIAMQAVIEFNLDGTILTANENFLKTLGYTLDEIKGKPPQPVCRAGLPRERGVPPVLGAI